MPSKPPSRWPRPDEYGTAAAVRTKMCPVCAGPYRTLIRPMFVTTRDGELLMVYQPGQLICDHCLQRKCAQIGVMVALS